MYYLLNDSSVYILHKLLPILCKAGGPRGTNSRKRLIEQCNQCQKLPEPVHDRLTTSSSGTAAAGNRSLLPTPSVLLSHWWHRMLFLLQHHRLSLNDCFSVCGLLTKGTRNMEKYLYMRAWLKVNFDELNDML